MVGLHRAKTGSRSIEPGTSRTAWPDFPAAAERLRRRYVMASFAILSTSMIVDTGRHNGLNWDHRERVG
jgi:hypothetical protein